MYNAIVLLSLLPLSGSDAGENMMAMPQPAVIRSAETVNNADERIPVLPSVPKRVVAAYTPEQSATAPQQPLRLAQQPVQPAMAAPAVSETVSPYTQLSQQPNDPNLVRVSGIIEVPKWNDVVLAAAYQSVLTTLKTEQRDDQGNVVKGADGKPIMVPIREGMYVFKDQILGSFDDRELQCNLEISECKLDVAIAEREKKIEIEYAAWGFRVAEAELQMLKETNQMHSGAISQIEVNKAELALRQAEANFKLQKYTIEEVKTREAVASEKDVARTKVLIELRRLIAPIDGMIVKIDKAEGEWLREGDPVLEIMQLNTLRARCKVSAKDYTPDMVDGKSVTVTMPRGNGRVEEFPGKVVFAHPKVEAGDWFEVFIEVENRPSGRSWLLQPGRDVAAVIHL